MNFQGWITKYEQKTREKFEPKNGFRLFFLPERGFCEIRADADKQMILVWQLCGDGHFWKDYAELLAQMMGYHNMGTVCIRGNIEAYIRLWGFSVEQKEVLPDGNFRFHCVNKDGKKGLVSPAWTENGKVSYFITWEVD